MVSSEQNKDQLEAAFKKGLTICAVDDVTPSLAVDALQRSRSAMFFDRALLLSSQCPQGMPSEIEHVKIPSINSRDEYSHFMLHDLHNYISTSHVLVVQWDGFVLDGSVWDDSFLDYDYIGAIWGWHAERKVGNGGFSLRSKRLLCSVATLAPQQMTALGEDEVICRVLADRLEAQFGIRFATESVAKRFAYERTLPEIRTLGFHGLFNLWRHLGDDELIKIITYLPDSTVKNREFLELMACCFAVKRFSVVHAGIKKISTLMDLPMIEAHFRQCGGDEPFIKALLTL
ncbi:DUF5672 family protein [Acetobacter peroxydans]|jgi:hypothetical protein|uniref:DUF5672 family protein n=1 Tax=Acetobacter peroxydans TaxID=104098 RepID=UPI002352E77E|nr:DUF5672 family protein [Acetobacter peroxydans]MCH4143746.1 hypothetical protein [Acetobacter peroxydans]MCI1410102.1 hypothetical protein [Acetobacter peroxydans]MCI1566860.1 hypothetical protein [Acetobacter peroxydans]MCI1617789.1 hypothetical protein [Acetobacter peroxydans]MCI1725371.1 hypothetical protein [Acetobacter peroxydans]